MKRYAFFPVFFASFLIGVAICMAVPQVWISSHTATADTTKILCQSNTFVVAGSTFTNGGKGILHSVCVNDASAGSGTVTIYNSSSTAVNPVAIIRSTSAVSSGCNMYDVYMSSGLVYTNSATNDVTITYECY